MVRIISFILTHAFKIIGACAALIATWLLWLRFGEMFLLTLAVLVVVCLFVLPAHMAWEKSRKR
jgi:hypothetical protein